MEQATRTKLNETYTHQHAWDPAYKMAYDDSANKLVEAQKNAITRRSTIANKLGIKTKVSASKQEAIKTADSEVKKYAGIAEKARHSNEKWETYKANHARSSMSKAAQSGKALNGNDEQEFMNSVHKMERLNGSWSKKRGYSGSNSIVAPNSIISKRNKAIKNFRR